MTLISRRWSVGGLRSSVADRLVSSGGRATLVAVLVVVGLGLVVWLPLVAGPPPPREIVLVAKDMAFYLDGGADPNPTITLRPGEEVQFVLRNEDPGVTHNLAVKAWEVATPLLRGAGTASVRVRVPDRLGRHEYRCTPHAEMMSGLIEVR